MTKRIRCAIYTRKSSEDGLEQDFNSLDAQREACEAFIRSQKGLGWVTLSKRYDDGGLSGGSMDRPALQMLLSDIDRGTVDLIVVYKVDRLTRSLMDFARIVEALEAKSISFVSVTQQFNTANSMGRLTLNVLLSFAQFEREVTAERIRDKIAASKKKGMWMGGLPPLGYDVKDKKLIVNGAEAKVVQTLFDQYLALGTVRSLKVEADRRGLLTKKRLARERITGGQPFTRGHLYQLLHNPIYVGEIAHKGQTYPGLHDGIVDRDTWVAVQAKLDSNAVERSRPVNDRHRSLLTGLIFDDTGDRLCPHYAVKKGRRYRYYVSKRRVTGGHNGDDGWRVPSDKLENAVMADICEFFNDERRLIDAIGLGAVSPTEIRQALKGAAELAIRIENRDLLQPHPDLRELIRRVTLSVDHLQIAISRRCLTVRIGTEDNAADDDDTDILIDFPITIRRRGVESKIILAESAGSVERDDKLIFLVARTRQWFDRIAKGEAMSVRETAREEGMDVGDVSRFLPLAFLAPDIVEAILAGRQPTELTAEKLKRLRFLPPAWEDQRQLLGFTG